MCGVFFQRYSTTVRYLSQRYYSVSIIILYHLEEAFMAPQNSRNIEAVFARSTRVVVVVGRIIVARAQQALHA